MTKTYFTEEGLDHLREAARAEIEQLKAEIARLGRELNLAKYGEPDFSWSIHKEAMADLLDRVKKAEAQPSMPVAEEPVAWEGWFEGCGSISSATRHTSHKSIADGWAGKGVKVTPLIPAAALDAARAEIERLTKTVENCRHDFRITLKRAVKAEAERDEALAQVATAYEMAAKICDHTAEYHIKDPDDIESVRATAAEIRALTPTNAKAALEAYGREKVREGMQRAAELCDDGYLGGELCNCRQFILRIMNEEASQ